MDMLLAAGEEISIALLAMALIQDEMRLLMVSEELSQSMLKDAFRGIGYGID